MSMSVRRVVTATTDDGRSYFMIDDKAGNVFEQPGRGLTFHELWVTDGPCVFASIMVSAAPLPHFAGGSD